MEHRNSTFKAKLQLGKCAIYITEVFACLVVLAFACWMASAEDWATYLHDNARSGITTEQLRLPLREVWVYTSKHAPQLDDLLPQGNLLASATRVYVPTGKRISNKSLIGGGEYHEDISSYIQRVHSQKAEFSA